LGGYYTGLATDPNTAPLFILLGIAIIGYPDLNKALADIYARIEKAIL